MNLCIDIGNTRTKLGLFEEAVLVEDWTTNHLTISGLKSDLANRPVHRVIVSSVAASDPELMQGLSAWKRVLELSHQTALPFENRYQTPLTLGKDRLAAVAGAQSLYAGQNNLIVDFGTCIKTEILTADGVYLGGNIAPGATMRIQAMHHFTARLPIVDMQMPESNIGISTETALQNGALRGVVYELEAYIRMMQTMFDSFNVLFSGGDAEFFKKHCALGNVFVEPKLLLHGLNNILNFNSLQSGAPQV
ncbi:MAG: type III pantothenate kinase [Saprospiraceae bacterium]|nr:type III pantothenate kinase [Saprospiraceae bacterium]